MISTTLNLSLNQSAQSTKIECKTYRSINVPYFFTATNMTNKVTKQKSINASKIVKNNKKEKCS